MPDYGLPPDLTMKVVSTPFSELIDWSQTFLGLPEIWKTNAGEGVKIAFLDTGVDEAHPDLDGQLIATRDFTGSPHGPSDKHSHGTHVTGIGVAKADSNGVRGIAFKSKAIHAKVLGDNGSGSDLSISRGLEWAASEGADIISCSFGGPSMSSRLRSVFDDIAAAGIIAFCATGNDGRGVNLPAAWPNNIGGGSVGKNGKLSRFTSRGPELDIAAPGEDVTSTIPMKMGGYAAYSGTSMATPIIAGAGALYLASERKAGKTVDLNKMRREMRRTGDKMQSGYLLLDAAELVQQEREDDNGWNGPFEFSLAGMDFRVYARAGR